MSAPTEAERIAEGLAPIPVEGVGITGTRDGIRGAQRNTLLAYLSGYREDGVEWQHNGDCLGADLVAGDLWRNLGGRIDLHPPVSGRLRAYQQADFCHDAKPYDVRNRDIVDQCAVLLAMPRGFYEERRSGTWQTIRYARRRAKSLIIIWPDGNATVENAPTIPEREA